LDGSAAVGSQFRIRFSELFLNGPESTTPRSKMKASRVLLGGGRRFLYPRYVWSPAGGYWSEGGKAPSVVLALTWVLAVSAVASYSGSHEVSAVGSGVLDWTGWPWPAGAGGPTWPGGADRPSFVPLCQPVLLSQKLHNPDGAEPMPSGLLRVGGREREDRGRA
jgi:hypothetical protein